MTVVASTSRTASPLAAKFYSISSPTRAWSERLFSRSGVEQASSPWRPSGMEHLPAWALIYLVEKLRKTGFRLYLHPLRSIDELLAGSGFQQENKAKSRFWLVFLYKRNRPDAPRRE